MESWNGSGPSGHTTADKDPIKMHGKRKNFHLWERAHCSVEHSRRFQYNDNYYLIDCLLLFPSWK